MRFSWCTIGVLLVALLGPMAMRADTVLCTMLMRASDGAIILQDGAHCDTRYSPASTFKLPLALIGFNTGHLTAPEAPLVPYDPAINATMEAWRAPTSPRRWLRYSVIWYSQWLTARLGMADFQSHIDALAYGNRDLSGDPGRTNGLSHAWLSSSLQISPREQLAFLQGLVSDTLPASVNAHALTRQTMQAWHAGPLLVKGKTGTAWVLDENHNRTRDQLGWFIGWTTSNGETYLFARIRHEPGPVKGFASQRTRASILQDLPDLLP
ncbi:hypothetical protein ACMU_12345 [Actibacterium mucosum KCTC 23349]|uniref:Beta-lactamase n=1 Tax=Actibacterium mucosum KCTC 23349 TaxID=1454373 RepID=A0A037ZKZ0_9RHOB|nr:penicillin-binding transpeptidase domain-containing protein [Actibacterium mucosum]KAJ55476.1 hypothetical protein ACMU_12345 [Actibacterium mucosum KCTC 23349]